MSLAHRRAAARKYQPERVRLLLVAEAPPCATDRYFYFETVDKHDWLFRYVWEGLTGEKPDREQKAAHLAAMRDAGVFMIDLHEDHVEQPTLTQLRPCVPGLVERCRGLKPEAIVLIKSIVYDASYAAVRDAGLPVVDVRMPFPASGQQPTFLKLFRQALDACGYRWEGSDVRRTSSRRRHATTADYDSA